MNDSICCECGVVLVCDESAWCRKCRKKPPETQEPQSSNRRKRNRLAGRCEMCNRYLQLTSASRRLCSLCSQREPELTIEEIYRRAAEIRAQRGPEWRMDD